MRYREDKEGGGVRMLANMSVSAHCDQLVSGLPIVSLHQPPGTARSGMENCCEREREREILTKELMFIHSVIIMVVE